MLLEHPGSSCQNSGNFSRYNSGQGETILAYFILTRNIFLMIIIIILTSFICLFCFVLLELFFFISFPTCHQPATLIGH